ncbi:hypothetical protein LAZ40_06910 [Cereibacter sphaeroides]|uniref:hypothetical protein n=1 Tax=Cereibacter sphaeroides TaxID=1063 RepID=UPI001F35EEB8|nr:hypothetical protein [Cereibacter sphaeroides]MCE6958777.1 hypothetical protein [Cereibacter sphaeroides]MCE6973349.1 hypothetical protein [Cereibacter sphaeroides]
MSRQLTPGRAARLGLMHGLEESQVDVLMHTLGLSRGSLDSSRNHYVAGGKDLATCRALVEAGLMEERPASDLSGGDPVFLASSLGRVKAKRMALDMLGMDWDGKPMTASQKRYLAYLDADTGETFGQWLDRKSREARVERFGFDPGPDPRHHRTRGGTEEACPAI